jgi:hypothetical protein
LVSSGCRPAKSRPASREDGRRETTLNRDRLKPSVPAAQHAENQRCVAENDGQENYHEFGQLMPAQIARQLREEQLPCAFYNEFSHSFKLLSFFKPSPG